MVKDEFKDEDVDGVKTKYVEEDEDVVVDEVEKCVQLNNVHKNVDEDEVSNHNHDIKNTPHRIVDEDELSNRHNIKNTLHRVVDEDEDYYGRAHQDGGRGSTEPTVGSRVSDGSEQIPKLVQERSEDRLPGPIIQYAQTRAVTRQMGSVGAVHPKIGKDFHICFHSTKTQKANDAPHL